MFALISPKFISVALKVQQKYNQMHYVLLRWVESFCRVTKEKRSILR